MIFADKRTLNFSSADFVGTDDKFNDSSSWQKTIADFQEEAT